MRRHLLLGVFAIASLALAACTNTPEVKPPATPSPAPATTASPAVSPSVSPTGSPAASASKIDSLVGQWSGVDRTSLSISKKGEKFAIEVANASGTKSFEGTAKGDTIEFTRDGKTESIKAASGAETGVKGLEKESNCVVIAKGKEAYCRK